MRHEQHRRLGATGRVWHGRGRGGGFDLAAAGRDEISLKVLIALSTDGLDPRVVIEHQRRFTMGLLQDLTQLRHREVDTDLAWQLHLDRLMYSAEAELKWLDRVESR